MNREPKGSKKACHLFEKYAPPNSAIAPIGVKLGKWGINLSIAMLSKAINKTECLNAILFIT